MWTATGPLAVLPLHVRVIHEYLPILRTLHTHILSIGVDCLIASVVPVKAKTCTAFGKHLQEKAAFCRLCKCLSPDSAGPFLDIVPEIQAFCNS